MKFLSSLIALSLFLGACSKNPTSEPSSEGEGQSSSLSLSGESPESSALEQSSADEYSSQNNLSSVKQNSSSSRSSSSIVSIDIVRQTKKADVGRYGTFTDTRDGKTYHWTEIGAQVWMAENITYEADTDPGVCYEYNPLGCDLFGRMYNFEQAQSACPTNWTLPSDIDYRVLLKASGVPQVWFDSTYGSDSIMNQYQYGNTYATTFFTSNLLLYSGLGTDDYHFRLLPAGYGEAYSYPWVFFNSSTELWTSTPANGTLSVAWGFYNSAALYPSTIRKLKERKTLGYVRCLYQANINALTQSAVPSIDPLFVTTKLPSTTKACERTPTSDEFCDARDGHVYAKKTIGTHVWMAQNLNYAGDGTLGICPGGTPAGCDNYGRLYQHHVAMTRPLGCDYADCKEAYPISQGICPAGWRIPTKDETYADIVTIDTTLLEANSLKNQFAGSISKSQGYKGDLEQQDLGRRLGFWIKPDNEYDLEAPMLEVYNSNTSPATVKSVRKYFSYSVRCIQDL